MTEFHPLPENRRQELREIIKQAIETAPEDYFDLEFPGREFVIDPECQQKAAPVSQRGSTRL